SRSTRVGRGGSNYWLVVAVAAPVLWAQFYRVFTIVGVAAAPGAGGATPVQAFVDHASQRQRSVRADTAVRVIRPRAPWRRVLRAFNASSLSLRRVSSGEQGRVNSRERQGPDQLNGAPALKKSLLPARQRLFLGSESAWF